ncbi:MAG: YgfZ/GcvT domain-containing protein, partial [Angustibacter sp.]
GVSYAAVTEADHPGQTRPWRLVVVPRAQVADVIADRPAAGLWAAEALRIAAWRPRCGVDTDHRTIVHEVDWLRTAVHLRKGCYRGQETVARVHNLGRPPRRLVLLHLDGSGHQLPEPGADVLLADRRVGQLMSVARHYELGPIGLALVKRAVDPTAPLLVSGIAAAQEVIVAP